MRRTLPLLTIAALVLVSACTNNAGAAARINGVEISTDALNSDLAGLVQSKQMRTQAAAQQLNLKEGRPVPIQFAGEWLASMLQNEAVAQIAKKRGVTATAEEISQTRSQLLQSDPTLFRQISKPVRDQLIEQRALLSALRASYPATSPLDSLAADCSTQRLVGHILVATEAEAQAAIDRLDAGETFAAVSSAVSTDTGSAAQGGLLLCEDSSQWTQLDESFRAAVAAVPTGEVSDPVQTQFGFHVIEVIPFNEANAQPLLATAQPPDPLGPVLTRFLTKAKIWVNPKYGKLDRSPGSFSITPPPEKQVKSRPATTTSTAPAGNPGPAPSGSGG